MRVPRLYLPQPLSSGTSVVLPRDRERYLCRVLRLADGAPLTLFNGDGGQYQAVLERNEASPTTVHIGEHQALEVESPLAIALLQGISRGERMEFTLRKATELGVSAIVPVFTSRCEVRLKGDRLSKRMAHWQGIISSACEQCGRNRLPHLHHPQPLPDALSSAAVGSAVLLDPMAQHHLADLPQPDGAISLLVGPEGGLSDSEIALAHGHGFQGLQLGPRVLRTETAPLAAMAAMQALWGDL